jgi:hypothetical protein
MKDGKREERKSQTGEPKEENVKHNYRGGWLLTLTFSVVHEGPK